MTDIPKSSALIEGMDLVAGERNDTYGDPVDCLTSVGRVWGALLMLEDIQPDVVAEMMVGLKLVRDIQGSPSRENLVDAAGYLHIAERSRP